MGWFASRRSPRSTGGDLTEAAGAAAAGNVGRTVVGVRDARHPAIVDGSGTVVTAAGWSVRWGVGADDRWRWPDRAGARQDPLGAPLGSVETMLRVPSGDVVQRVWAAQVGTVETVAVEFENRSPVPVALAVLAVPAASPAGPGQSWQLDGRVLRLNGRPALVLPAPPARVAGAASTAALQRAVEDGAAPEGWDPSWAQRPLALIVPLLHRGRVRLVLPTASVVGPGDVPDADAVARGWRLQLDAGTRLNLPDPRLEAAADRARVVALADAGAAPAGLAAFGHGDAALDRLGPLFADPAAPLATQVADLAEAALVIRWTGEADLAAALLPTAVDVATAVERAQRRPRPPLGSSIEALRWAGEVMAAAGEKTAAAELLRRAGGATVATPVADVAVLIALLGATPAAGLVALHDLLATDSPGAPVRLLGAVPPAWWGQHLDVVDLTTGVGAIDFAVRWHGARPALLWDHRLRAPAAAAPPITVPGIAPAWSSDESRGEVLLPAQDDPAQR
jgi:hypothetical protein